MGSKGKKEILDHYWRIVDTTTTYTNLKNGTKDGFSGIWRLNWDFCKDSAFANFEANAISVTLATVSFQRGRRSSWHPPPEESIPTWGEPPLLGRGNADNETEKQAKERGHGCRFKLTWLTEVNKKSSVFPPPYSINSQFPTYNRVQSGDWNHAMFHCATRCPTRTRWTTRSLPRPKQLHPIRAAFFLNDGCDSNAERHSFFMPANHIRTNGKRRMWGCFRIFCESGAAECLFKNRRKWTCATCDTFLRREWGTLRYWRDSELS